MMSNLKVEDLRFSFIWTQVFTELFEASELWAEILTNIFKNTSVGVVSADSQKILDSKSISDTYKLILEEIKSGKVNLLQLPWLLKVDNPKYVQNFWRFYLMDEEDREPIGLEHSSIIDRAWKQLVPLRSKASLPYKVGASWLQNGRVSIESFYYPFGLGLVISVSCNHLENQPLSSDDVIAAAIKVKETGKFSVQWDKSDSKKEEITLEELAISCFEAILKEKSPVLTISNPLPPPFSIATIVKGSIDRQDSDDLNDGEIHRMLEGLTLWKRLKPFQHATDLRECKIEFDRKCFPSVSENHWLYHHHRSRAVFFPDAFSLPGIHTLGCYHRNLVMASLQVESLGCLVREVDKVLQEGKYLNPTYEFFTRRATGILSRLYGCHTYRSPSLRLQIDKNGLVEPINRARDRWINKGKNDSLYRGCC